MMPERLPQMKYQPMAALSLQGRRRPGTLGRRSQGATNESAVAIVVGRNLGAHLPQRYFASRRETVESVEEFSVKHYSAVLGANLPK